VSIELVLAYVGKIVLWLVSAAGVAWAAFKFLPERWVQHRFERQLEQQRNEHAQQLEEARHRLNMLAKRMSKLHDKEFDAISEIWEKLNEALALIGSLVSALQTFPDLDREDDPHFKAFVDGSNLEQVDKNELLGKLPGDRNEFYQRRIFRYRLRDARKACAELHRAIQRNSIFLEPKLLELLRKVESEAWRTLTTREIGEEAGDRKLSREAGERLDKEIVPLKDEIERQVQKRLGYE